MPEFVGWSPDTPTDPVTGTPYPTGGPPSNIGPEPEPDPWKGYGYGNRRIKYKPSPTPKKIIGVTDAILSPAEPGTPALNVSKFDTTSYLDRAIVQLENDTGGDAIIGNFAIKGNIVWQLNPAAGGYSGGGYILQYTDYGDVEINGEKEFKICNDFIFNKDQIEHIFDFYKKELRPHDMYTLSIPGYHPYFCRGDLWTLSVTHSMPASTSEQELINIDVQIRGVSIERRGGSIGETLLSVRVPSGAWTKTTSRRAKLALSGLPMQNLSRTTEVTVASRDYAGQADYHCDGTNDEVEIQAALDYVGKRGGGVVRLLSGNYYVSENGTTDYCIILNNQYLTLQGESDGSSIINCANEADDSLYPIRIGEDNCQVFDIKIICSGTYAATRCVGIYMFASYSRVSRCNISGVYDGIYILGELCTIDGCYISCARNGGHLYVGTDIRFEGNTIYTTGSGIVCDSGSSKNMITKNTIKLTGACSRGIQVAGTAEGNIIEYYGNMSSGNHFGIQSISAAGTSVISGNTIIHGGTTSLNAKGIVLQDEKSICGNNYITFTGTYSDASVNGVLGISIEASGCIVSGNIILFNFASTGGRFRGIYGLIGGNNIVGNTITGMAVNSAYSTIGIILAGTCDACQISSNRITSFTNSGSGTSYGVYIDTGSNSHNFIGNYVSGNETDKNDLGTSNTFTGNIGL